MTLMELVRDTTRIVSVESRAPTNCGHCNKPLPLPYTDRRYKIEGSRMQLSFCGWKCVTDYERQR